jgi:CBS-domain-containing membrane protein
MDGSSTTSRESLKPGARSTRLRQRLTLRDELLLAVVPTVTVLLVFGFIEMMTQQRLLFASLASSAFLIYLDPEHGTNRIRTLAMSQLIAALIGFLMFETIGATYLAGAIAMVASITLMIVLDVVHPPAVATAIAFAFRAGDERNLALFAVSVVLIVALVVTQASTLRLLARLRR